MFILMTLVWVILGSASAVGYYITYAESVAKRPAGKAVIAVAISQDRTGSELVVFGRSAKASPLLATLREIAEDVRLLMSETDFGDETVQQFLKKMNLEFTNATRVRIPEPIARGLELHVGRVQITDSYLHPSYNRHRTMVIAKPSILNGRLTQLPWDKPRSQKIFKGLA